MLCSEWSLVKHHADHAEAIALRCRSWRCPLCLPMRQQQLTDLAIRGTPERFITLTIRPDTNSTTAQRAANLARAWRVCLARWRRLNPGKRHEYLAVFEATKRGEPHLHILVRGPFIAQRWLSAQMSQLINSPIVDIRRVNNPTKAAAYIAKYVGKAPHRFGTCKRYWHTKLWAPADPQPASTDTGWRIEQRSLDQIAQEWRHWRAIVEPDGQGGIRATWQPWQRYYYPNAGPWAHAPPLPDDDPPPPHPYEKALLGMGLSPHDPSC